MNNTNAVSNSTPKRHAGQRPRSSPRVPVNRRAVLLMPRSGQPHPVLLDNVSTGGACVQTDAQLSIGEDVRLRIQIADNSMLTLNAIITGVRPRPTRLYAEYGMRFIGIDRVTQSLLDEFIERRLKRA